MGKTIAEKILSKHSNNDAHAGDLVVADLDFVMGQDGTSPLAIRAFEEMGATEVFNKEKVVMVIDHSAPSPLEGVSALHHLMREFAKDKGIKLYDIGCGVCHQLVPEQGHVAPGNLVVGADSHTCSYGAINVFSTGAGSTDIAAAMASGKLWFKVPETIKYILNNKLAKGVYSKDLILYLIGKITADGATYKAVEFTGETIGNLSIDARFTISNMAIEMGAKAGLMEADDKTIEWVKKRNKTAFEPVSPDSDANYLEVIECDCSKIEPQIAKPHTVDNVSPISELEGTPIHQAFIGTCTNGRLEDFKIASQILAGKKINSDVRFIIAPASKDILLEATNMGYMQKLIEAGAALVTAGCGPCVGTHNGVPSDGENVISTANRNFKGRMGNSNASIYLGSPATVAASALTGKITDPRNYL
ncbi:MAG: 3-isopropylmalate dehydratase large subunit [Actinobacteria bacterium]|nr:MAG: 3-isopropylmalate dehydratase large subunit [Actinomycetota bacterium]